MRVAVVLVAAVGCYNPTVPAGAPCTDDNGCPTGQACIGGFCGGTELPDGGGSATVDATPFTCDMWKAKHFNPCTIPPPGGDLALSVGQSGYTLDTASGTLKGKMGVIIPTTTMVVSQALGPDVMLVSVRNFNVAVGASLTINGARPAVFAVWGTATITGTIDASATLGTPGPGGDSMNDCGSSTGNNGTNIQPSQGGGGGGMQGAGGKGGNVGANGGTSIGSPSAVRGGCAGGLGGSGTTTTAPRGAGGGAVQITSPSSITVSGTIDAGGGGGSGGRANYGGGAGGGGGGFIGLDAPTVTVTGTLAANGGAGGGGASDVADGNNGGDARTTTTPASAGTGATTSNVGTCANGGVGASGSTLVGSPGATSLCGGGGGGGGAGYILVWSTSASLGGTITPGPRAGP